MNMLLKHRSWAPGRSLGALSLGALSLLGVLVFSGAARAKDEPMPNSSYLRILHAIPGAPKVDVYVDGKKKLNDITFGALTKYLRMPAGTHRISIVANPTGRVLATGYRSLLRNRFHTAAAVGTKGRPRLRVHNETLGRRVPTRAHVFAFHYAPGAPPLDVVALKPDGRVLRLFRHLRFGQTRAVLAPPGPATIQVRAGGRVIRTLPPGELQGGRRYSAFAIGRIGRAGPQAFRVLLNVSSSQ